MSKGLQTKELILKTALDFTSKFGLESLSIGELAKNVGMSKSGLFGHFKSKEILQIKVLDYAAENFVHEVIRPAINEQRGLKRLRAMMENWKKWSGTHFIEGGCPFLSSIIEYDDRPGKVQDRVKFHQAQMINTFERSFRIAIEEDELNEKANIKLMAYNLYSNMIGYHIYSRLLKVDTAEDMFWNSYTKLVNDNTKS